THLRLYQVDFAQQLLAQERANPHTLLYSTVLADYHTVVGEYAEAIDIARRRLCADPHDIEAGILLGNTFHAARLFFLADAAYLQTLAECTAPADPRRNEIRRLMARNFTLSRRFDQAIAVLDALLAENPHDIAARLLLVDTLTKARQFDAALAMAHAPPDDTNARNALALRTQTAYTLLEAGRLPDAAQTFDQLAVDPNCRTPDVAYGLYRTASLLGRPEVAQAAKSLGPTPLAPAAAWATIFAGRASGYCDCSAAGCALDESLQGSPHNVLLLTMRGEAAKQCGCGCRSGICQSCRPVSAPGAGTAAAAAVGWFDSALQLSPTNIRARLGLARSDVELLRYGQALAEYQTALKYVPEDINVLREMGRTLDSVQGIRRAGAIYGTPLAESAQTPLQPMTPPQTIMPQTTMPNSPESPFLPGVETGEPGIVMGQLVTHEYEARLLRNWKDHRAVAWYEQSVCVEPTNEQAYFDLGQADAAINRTHAALDAYGQLLTADPCHRDAATAFNRLQLELRPKTIVRYDYLFQSGRQGLANMTVADYSIGQRYSLGDENEFVEAGFRQRVLYPTDGPSDLGEIVYSRVQKKVALDTLAFAEVDVERYQYGFTT
ncbi:MAG TPA: tetratricopeptide repeat protein, partial [Pirellulales bacterium]|nr:tetratricopeptide repeat protein [Pirellulales bacterium]